MTPPEDPDISTEVEIDEPVELPSSSAPVPDRHPDPEVLPRKSSDEADLGWGDGPSGYGDDWYEAERPPHHG